MLTRTQNMKNERPRHKKLILVIAEDWYFWSHRLPLARAARDAGFDVVIATRVHHHAQKIQAEGFKLAPLYLCRESYSPWTELRAVVQLRRLYREERPDIVHHVALKPILYGSIAAFGRRHIRVINALAGLGYLVASSSFKARLLRLPIWNAFKFLLNRPGTHVILQNADDMEVVTSKLKVPVNNAVLIRGAGVDCEAFHPVPDPPGDPHVILPSRMLWNKGVAEFVEAAKLLRQQGIRAKFVLVGDVDPASPSGMPRGTLSAWNDAGFVEWWGLCKEMMAVYQGATLVCLPSHGGEGVPKALLEAAACGKAIVTSDVPGCRDIVRNGVNGLLISPKNINELAAALRYLLENDEARRRMGAAGREIAVREFSQEMVIEQTMALYSNVFAPKSRHLAETHSAS